MTSVLDSLARPRPAAAPAKHAARPDIQGMRALAVLLVFADHLFKKPTGGFVGVDVFFVISGYLITGLLVREGEKKGRPSIRDFYARRFRRIIPVAAVVLIVTNLVAGQVFTSLRAHQTRVDSLWALLFGANIHFSAIGTDYFQQNRPPSAVQHFWSLSVEEQFYVAWPLLIIAAFLLLARTGRGGRTTVLLLAVVGSVASFVWSVHLVASDQTVAYFSTPARAWELGVGAVLAVAQPHLSRLADPVRSVGAWFGMAAIATAALTFSDSTKFPGAAAALPVFGAGLILAANNPRFGPGAAGILNNRASRYVGDISYSLYLWHFPCIVLAGGYFVTRGPSYYLAAGALPFVLSVASYHLVEDPIRGSSWLDKKPTRYRRRSFNEWAEQNKRTLDGLMVLTAVVVTAGAALVLRAPKLPDVGGQYQITASASGTGATGSAKISPIEAALAVQTLGHISPSLDQLPKSLVPEWIHDNCLTITNESDMARCVYGDKGGSKTAVVIGDSIAISYMPAIENALAGKGWRIQVLTYVACPEVNLQTWKDPSQKGQPYQKCYDHRAFALSEIKQIKPDLIISASRSAEFVNMTLAQPRGTAGIPAWQASVTQRIEELKPYTKKFVFLNGPPESGNLQECLTGKNQLSSCNRPVSDLWSQMDRADTQAAASAKVSFIETKNWFCYENECPAVIGGTPVYWDGTHLTAAFSKTLAGRLAKALAL